MLGDAEPAKILLPYVHRADELQKFEPLVAYYCRLYAMERMLKIPVKERTEATNGSLVSLTKQLEKDKKSVVPRSDDGLYIEGFATKLFLKADKQERRGKATLNTAKTFYAASLFFEILHQFGNVPVDLERKQMYAAWKAAEIRKSAVKKLRKRFLGPLAIDKALPILDHGFSNSESILENKAVRRPEPKFSLKQSPAVGLEIDTQQDQPHGNVSDPSSVLDTESGDPISGTNIGTERGDRISGTSIGRQQDSSDDEQPFYDCSDEPDHDVLIPDGSTEQDHTISGAPIVDAQSQEYHPSAAETTGRGDPLFSHDVQSRASGTISSCADDQGQEYGRSAAGIVDQDVRVSRDIGRGWGRINSLPADVHGQHHHPAAAEIVKALKVSRLAVSALAFDDVPAAVSYIKQALDLLTNDPKSSGSSMEGYR